ncbi:MAG: tyrosinase family protein [Alphaproteobacteria bacterium]|nr:tyrosinase family protein [Alphaproteobacteria bacterium]
MAGIRENILNSASVRDAFLDGVVALDAERPGIRASDLAGYLQRAGIPLRMVGLDQDMSTYDLFVFWHIAAMSMQLSVGNAAHGGPIFLPWHRWFLIRLEQQLQRVLGDDDFGLPYWDWAEDGERQIPDQWRTDLWTSAYLGEARGDVRSGKLGAMRVRLDIDSFTTGLESIAPRPLTRSAGVDWRWRDLPNKDEERFTHGVTPYDEDPWDGRARGHRNRLEGFWSDPLRRPGMHNRVHVWIGGDMGPGTSPNDPVFFLNHCNVDRLWEHWMAENDRQYEPGPGRGSAGHRLDSVMFSIFGDRMTPADVLDPTPWYSYDTLLIA